MRPHAPHRARTGSAPRATVIGLGAAGCGAILMVTWAALARPTAFPGASVLGSSGVASDAGSSLEAADAVSLFEQPAHASRSLLAGSQAPGTSTEDEDLPQRRRSGPHARLREAWTARARADAAAFERDVRTLLADGTAAAETAAALSAAGDARLACADHLLAEALAAPDVEGPRAGSLPRFALAELARRAAREGPARAELERTAFDRPELAPTLRGVAAAELAAVADAALALRMLDRIAAERDPSVRESALAALRSRPQDELVRARLEEWFGAQAPPAGPAPAAEDGSTP